MIFVGALLLAIFFVPSPWGIVVAVAGLAVEVAESWFWIRLSKRRRAAVGAETLIGATAEVAQPCRPIGQVRIAGELWRARCSEGADIGETVRVLALDGLTLVVERT